MQQIRLENLNIWIKILKRIYGIVFLSIWTWFIYQCFLIYTQNRDFFLRIINLEFLEDKTMLDPIVLLGIHCMKVLGIFIASLIIYSIIKKIFRAIPIPTSFIDKWNNTNQISPMLAHRLISYYTYNTKLSFYDLINIYNASRIEASILSYNFNNKNLTGLFKRFNPQLVGEILIYNTYFPHMNLWQTIKTFFTGKPFRKPLLSSEKNTPNLENLDLNNSVPLDKTDTQDPSVSSELYDNSNFLEENLPIDDINSITHNNQDDIDIYSISNEKTKNPFLEIKKSNN